MIYNFLIIFYSPLCLSNDDNYNNKIIEQKDNLNQIQKQIKTLKNDLTNKENDKNLTANKISESTEKINSLQQKLQELNAKYQQKSKQLNKLQNNIKILDKTLKNNQKLLSNLLYWKYLNIQQTNIVTFEKSNNLQNFKNSYYLQQIIQSQNNLLNATQKDLITRQNLAVNLSNEQQNLEKIRQTQNSYKEELQQQKLSHQRRFDELNKQVNLQKQKIQTLKEDEKNLTKL
ncbi:MAG: murein hydrolase activator EnvC family protein, partial [Rhodocyclaceae bacterium]